MFLAMTSQDTTILLAAGFTAAVWLMARAKIRGRTRASGTTTERPASFSVAPRTGDVKAMADELNKLLVELQEAARRISAQIDNRYQKLDALLAEADEKIRRLEQLKQEIEAASGHGAAAIYATPLPPSAAIAAEDPQHLEVYALADRGKNPREIAQQVGKQPGEVELILALRSRATGS